MSRNTFGSSITVTLFGESHGPEIGAVLDGFAPGIPVDEEYIARKLMQRRPSGGISTARVEPDRFRIVSGVFNGLTTGAPISIVIPNEDARSRDYSDTRFIARPGHADYTAYCKYHGYEDYRGGGHFSGRLTAALVAAGAVALYALEHRGIRIGTHVLRCAGISDRGFEDMATDLKALSGSSFPVLDPGAAQEMRAAIELAAAEGDSVGGILETVICGLPAGVGEPWFDSVESILSHILFSVPGIKGVEFGLGFEASHLPGSQVHDQIVLDRGNGFTRTSNNAGGLEGGMTTGMPLIVTCAMKPIPTLGAPLQTIDLDTLEPAAASTERSDVCAVPACAVVAESEIAFELANAYLEKFGHDNMTDIRAAVAAYKQRLRTAAK